MTHLPELRNSLVDCCSGRMTGNSEVIWDWVSKLNRRLRP